MCGYVLAVLDSKEFYFRFEKEWLPSMLDKYPVVAAASQSKTRPGPEEVREGAGMWGREEEMIGMCWGNTDGGGGEDIV